MKKKQGLTVLSEAATFGVKTRWQILLGGNLVARQDVTLLKQQHIVMKC